MTDRQAQDDVALEFDRHRYVLAVGLEQALDVEAGLREILLHSRHATLVENLADVLDVESGLAAIVPQEYSVRTQSWPDPVSSDPIRSARDTREDQRALLERFVWSVEPRQRLALRGRTQVTATLRDYELAFRIAKELEHAHRHAAGLVDYLADAARLDPRGEHVRARAREHHTLRGISRVHHNVLNFASHVLARAWTPDEVRKYATRLTDSVGDALDCSERLLDPKAWPQPLIPTEMWSQADSTNLMHALIAAMECAGHLAQRFLSETRHEIGLVLGRFPLGLNGPSLRALLHDFTTSDLRGVTLTEVDLAGVRWSGTGTRWPETIDIEDLKDRSQESPKESGIYVVRPLTAPATESAPWNPT
ncbi:hypothetical protein [Embleya sp. NBC_00896]|uniref:hypothetical protein n=1 Tax=Embleya sp. NBC_00896 TaxID=2975961 RepID=UPI002F90690D|nr:hypothetical protein OG928_44980 [Embleya sp. NBC_00896]